MSTPYQRQSNHNIMQRGSNFGNKSQQANEASKTLMELENNDRWNELGEQVALLKGLTLDINQEVKSQNSLLDGMGGTFSSTTDMFKNTIGKIGVMMQTGGSTHMLALVGFVVFVFLMIYFLMGRK